MQLRNADYSRAITRKGLSMWGTLYTDPQSGALVGWIVNSWSEIAATRHLRPEMHWVEKDEKDGKFYRMRFNFDVRRIEIFGEDRETEPERAAFIRETLATWEKEYLEDEAKRLRQQ